MGREYTEAQKKATADYMKNRKTLRIVVTEGEHKQIQEHATKFYNGSMNAFVKRAITETMTRDTTETPKIVEDVAAMYPTPNQIQKIKELKEQRKKQEVEE